eukprot:TRINITY_DN103026_c0_g1_i1.p1 TRINITY_DN103026_c0_g1~~TRINITY_DN103026_c0_g1_i1.p1  ORF type:complete len:135 (+),score=2.83 TRINITY_DN103026_c0_g1_i1:28-405(+)
MEVPVRILVERCRGYSATLMECLHTADLVGDDINTTCESEWADVVVCNREAAIKYNGIMSYCQHPTEQYYKCLKQYEKAGQIAIDRNCTTLHTDFVACARENSMRDEHMVPMDIPPIPPHLLQHI